MIAIVLLTGGKGHDKGPKESETNPASDHMDTDPMVPGENGLPLTPSSPEGHRPGRERRDLHGS